MDGRIYCCEANAAEPMLGTADVVDVWLLLEYRPAWRAKAWVDNDLAEGTKRWLADGIAALAAQGLKVRPQMIRQPEGSQEGFRLLLHREGTLRAFRAADADYGDLAATPLAALALGEQGERLDAPHYFVCVNGQRDRCCARFGLPVYHRLRTLVGERAWQVTHLGGHRFAPNVLVLPQGALYGRVHPGAVQGGADALADFVAEVESDGMPLSHLRGRSCYPQAVQAAEGLAGANGLDLVAVDGDDDKAMVTFTRNGRQLRVGAARSDKPMRILASCGDRQTKKVRPYVSAG